MNVFHTHCVDGRRRTPTGRCADRASLSKRSPLPCQVANSRSRTPSTHPIIPSLSNPIFGRTPPDRLLGRRFAKVRPRGRCFRVPRRVTGRSTSAGVSERDPERTTRDRRRTETHRKTAHHRRGRIRSGRPKTREVSRSFAVSAVAWLGQFENGSFWRLTPKETFDAVEIPGFLVAEREPATATGVFRRPSQAPTWGRRLRVSEPAVRARWVPGTLHGASLVRDTLEMGRLRSVVSESALDSASIPSPSRCNRRRVTRDDLRRPVRPTRSTLGEASDHHT